MRALVLVVAAFAISIAGGKPSAATESDADILSTFVATRYAYLNEKGVDWAAASKFYRAQYVRASNRRARFAVLERMLDELYDPHSHLTSNYRDSWRLPAYDIWAENRGSAFVVTEVRSGSPARGAGLRAGDRLLSIDGRAVAEAMTLRLPRFLRAPDPAAERWALLSALSGRHDRSRTLEIRNGAGQKRIVVIPIARDGDVASAAVSSRTIGGVGYIAIRTFDDAAVVARFDAALDEMKNVKALIVDVRNNNGGDTAVMLPVAGRFLIKRSQYAWMARRSGSRLGARWPEYVDPRGPWTYSGKLIVLVDRWSESVAEGFAMAMSETRGAIVVGTPMAGLSAAVKKIHLPQTGVDAQISAEPVYGIDGKPRSSFEPSILVNLASATGDDPILAAGLATAAQYR